MSYSSWTSNCEKVNVRFTINYDDVSNETDVVGVIGSSKCLGNWDPENALLLERRGYKGCWSSTVKLPLSRYIEWKFVVIDRLTRKIKIWEEYPNRWNWIDRGPIEIIAGWKSKELTRCSSCRCLVGLCSCKTIYTNLVPKEGLVNVTFRVIHSVEEENETIAVVGSSKFLGDWDPTYSRLFSAHHNPVLTIQLPVNTCFQWKLAVLNSQHRKVICWEECENRSLRVQTCPLEVGVTWSKTAESGYRCFWLNPDWVIAPCPCGRRYCNNKDFKGNERKVKDLLDIFDITNKATSDNRNLKPTISNASNKDTNIICSKRHDQSFHLPEIPVSRVLERDERSDESEEESSCETDKMLDDNYPVMKEKTNLPDVAKDRGDKNEIFQLDKAEHEKSKDVNESLEIGNTTNIIHGVSSSSYLKTRYSKEMIDMFESLEDRWLDETRVVHSDKDVKSEYNEVDSNSDTDQQIETRSSVLRCEEFKDNSSKKQEKFNLTDNSVIGENIDVLPEEKADDVNSDQQEKSLVKSSTCNYDKKDLSNQVNTICTPEPSERRKHTFIFTQRKFLPEKKSNECNLSFLENSLAADKMVKSKFNKTENTGTMSSKIINQIDHAASKDGNISNTEHRVLFSVGRCVLPLTARQFDCKRKNIGYGSGKKSQPSIEQSEKLDNDIVPSSLIRPPEKDDTGRESSTPMEHPKKLDGYIEPSFIRKQRKQESAIKSLASIERPKKLDNNMDISPLTEQLQQLDNNMQPPLSFAQTEKVDTGKKSFSLIGKEEKTDIGIQISPSTGTLKDFISSIETRSFIQQQRHQRLSKLLAQKVSSDSESLTNKQDKNLCGMSVTERKTVKLVSFSSLLNCKTRPNKFPENNNVQTTVNNNENFTQSDNNNTLTAQQKFDLSNILTSEPHKIKKPAVNNKNEKTAEKNEPLFTPTNERDQPESVIYQSNEQEKVINVRLDCTESSPNFAKSYEQEVDYVRLDCTENTSNFTKANDQEEVNNVRLDCTENTSNFAKANEQEEVNNVRSDCTENSSAFTKPNEQENVEYERSPCTKNTVNFAKPNEQEEVENLRYDCTQDSSNFTKPEKQEEMENVKSDCTENTSNFAKANEQKEGGNVRSDYTEKSFTFTKPNEKDEVDIVRLDSTENTSNFEKPNEQEEVENVRSECTENSSNFAIMSFILATSALAAVIVGSCVVDRFVHK